uniref:Reverse transcriptase domain-containing protein n=2 Tax=Aegilops tauschii subsp. strangulata TaxID=200361 RepID=A0A452YEI4_AEGTS
TLIPKKVDAAYLFDYRPISLTHIVAKLFAKVLSLRLAPRLAEMVSSNQSAFIVGRSVHDNFILVQQTARQLHQLRLPRVLLKLDIA